MNLHIYAAGFRTFLRQTSSPLRPQCRSIHLWHAASSTIAHGNHVVKALKPAAEYKGPADIEIDLWAAKPREQIGRITLEKALADYIKPGTALLPARAPPEPTDKRSDLARYFLVDLNTKKPPSVKDKQKRGSKEFHLRAKSTPAYLEIVLQKAFFLLANGVNVEFHVHLKRPLKKGAKDDRAPIAHVHNLVENVSLRPDVIGKALPVKSGTIIDPQDAGSEICWVVGGVRLKHDARPSLKSTRKKSMSKLKENKAAQEILDQHGVGVLLKEERNEIKRRLRGKGQWEIFKKQREVVFQEMQIRDPRLAEMVMAKARPLATPKELLRLFEKALHVIGPQRKFLTELEAERRAVARQIIHRVHDISDFKKRQDAKRNNRKCKSRLEKIARAFKRLESLPFEAGALMGHSNAERGPSSADNPQSFDAPNTIVVPENMA